MTLYHTKIKVFSSGSSSQRRKYIAAIEMKRRHEGINMKFSPGDPTGSYLTLVFFFFLVFVCFIDFYFTFSCFLFLRFYY